jgi:hypothetical protein
MPKRRVEKEMQSRERWVGRKRGFHGFQHRFEQLLLGVGVDQLAGRQDEL